MNDAVNDPIEQFLLDPIPTGLDSKREVYQEGRKLLRGANKNDPEYKWIESKIRRILKAIDK